MSKTLSTLIVSLCSLCVQLFLGFGSAPALAQYGASTSQTQSQTAAPGQHAASMAPASHTGNAVGEFQVRRASKVIGADVMDAQGRKIGDIKDVVFDPARGQVAYAVVGFGGVMGLGTRYYAIPWNVMHQSGGPTDRFVVNLTRDQMHNAPSFERNQWPDMANEAWHRDVSRFYAQAPYWEGSSMGAAGNRAGSSTMGGSGSGGEPASGGTMNR